MNKLESYQTPEIPHKPSVDVALFDGGHVLHSYLSKAGRISSYGSLARNLLSYLLRQYNDAPEVHVCFDTYPDTSLKLQKRERRGHSDSQFLITGPEQAPKQLYEILLRNSS